MRPRRPLLIAAVTTALSVVSVCAQSGDESPTPGTDNLLTPRWWPESLRTDPAPAPALRTDFSSFLNPEARQWGAGQFLIPFTAGERRLDADRSVYSRALSIQWQHRANADNRYTVTARRDKVRNSDADPATASGLAASLVWQHSLNNDARFTSRLFLGDEESRAPQTGNWGRRYLGLEVEGRYQLGSRHAPFASLRWQRSDYENLDSLSALNNGNRRESGSRFAAGWAYQPLPNWDFRAEAKLRLTEDGLDPADNDRSRLYFSTQYGFR